MKIGALIVTTGLPRISGVAALLSPSCTIMTAKGLPFLRSFILSPIQNILRLILSLHFHQLII